ncbi:unnamed protein product [Lampetra planeri]
MQKSIIIKGRVKAAQSPLAATNSLTGGSLFNRPIAPPCPIGARTGSAATAPAALIRPVSSTGPRRVASVAPADAAITPSSRESHMTARRSRSNLPATSCHPSTARGCWPAAPSYIPTVAPAVPRGSYTGDPVLGVAWEGVSSSSSSSSEVAVGGFFFLEYLDIF